MNDSKDHKAAGEAPALTQMLGVGMGTMDKLFDGENHDYYPAWVCLDCGNKYGRGYPERHCCTVHNGTCGICGRQKPVTEPRDFGHLKQGWREQYEREASNIQIEGRD